MIRSLLRACGFVLLAAAFAALVVDGSRSIAGGRALFSSLGDGAAWLGGARVAAVLGGVAAWPAPAGRAAVAALSVPGFAATGLLGLLLLHLGRRPAAGIGFSGRRS